MIFNLFYVEKLRFNGVIFLKTKEKREKFFDFIVKFTLIFSLYH